MSARIDYANAINGWNRLAVSFKKKPGTYEPRIQHHAMATAG